MRFKVKTKPKSESYRSRAFFAWRPIQETDTKDWLWLEWVYVQEQYEQEFIGSDIHRWVVKNCSALKVL